MGYNKKILSQATASLNKTKAPAKKKDRVINPSPFISNEGFKQGPPPEGTYYRIPSNVIYNPTPYDILATASTGEERIIPAGDTDPKVFKDAVHVDERQLKKGGQKNSTKKYSRSLSATNKLFDKNLLFKKPKSKKKKIFDPNAKYYQDGGATSPEEWEQEIRAIERQIGNPKKWSSSDYTLLQDKLDAYRNWRETTPEGQAVRDLHNTMGEYTVPVPAHLHPNRTKLSNEEEQAFQNFYQTLPDNLMQDDVTYDIRGYWDGLGRPEAFDYSQPKESDGYYHAFSINPNTGEYLKSPAHESFQHAVDEDRKMGWRPVSNVHGRNIATYNESIADPEQQSFLMNTDGPANYIETELTPEEIEQYRKGGWIVEELPQAQEGIITQPELTYDAPETFAYATPAAEKKHKQLMDKVKSLMTTVRGREAWYQDVKPKDFTNKELSRFIQGAEDYRKQAEAFERARRKVKEDKISTTDFARMYEERDWSRFDPNVMKEGRKGQYQNAVNEANARKAKNMGVTDAVLEATGAPALKRVAEDPLGTLQAVGQTAADAAMVGTGLNRFTNDTNPITGEAYGSSLNKVLDLASVLPFAGYLGATDDLARASKYFTRQTPLKNAYTRTAARTAPGTVPTFSNQQRQNAELLSEWINNRGMQAEQLQNFIQRDPDWARLVDDYSTVTGNSQQINAFLSGTGPAPSSYTMPNPFSQVDPVRQMLGTIDIRRPQRPSEVTIWDSNTFTPASHQGTLTRQNYRSPKKGPLEKIQTVLTDLDKNIGSFLEKKFSNLKESTSIADIENEVNRLLEKGVGVKKGDFKIKIAASPGGTNANIHLDIKDYLKQNKELLEKTYPGADIDAWLDNIPDGYVNSGNISIPSTLASNTQSRTFTEMLRGKPREAAYLHSGTSSPIDKPGLKKTGEFPFEYWDPTVKDNILNNLGVSGEYNKAINEVLKSMGYGLYSGGTGHFTQGAKRYVKEFLNNRVDIVNPDKAKTFLENLNDTETMRLINEALQDKNKGLPNNVYESIQDVIFKYKKKGGYVDNQIPHFQDGGTVEYLTQDKIDQLRAGAATYLVNPWNTEENLKFEDGGIIVDLDDESQIQNYIDQGYIVEFDEGGFVPSVSPKFITNTPKELPKKEQPVKPVFTENFTNKDIKFTSSAHNKGITPYAENLLRSREEVPIEELQKRYIKSLPVKNSEEDFAFPGMKNLQKYANAPRAGSNTPIQPIQGGMGSLISNTGKAGVVDQKKLSNTEKEIAKLDKKSEKLKEVIQPSFLEKVNRSQAQAFQGPDVYKAADDLDNLLQQGQNYLTRQNLKNSTGKEPTVKPLIENKETTKLPSIITGDPIYLNKRRYYTQEVVDLNSVKLGYRNRNEYRDINTEAGNVTAFNPFLPKSKMNLSKIKSSETFIGIDKTGKFKTGTIDKFNSDDLISKTFSNVVVDFVYNSDGTVKLEKRNKDNPNNPVPVVKVIENGKQQLGSLNFLTKSGVANPYEQFGEIQGGRVILKSGNKTILVSGSVNDVVTQFKKLKEETKQPVEFITLDNGSYNLGIRTKDKKITTQDLKEYDNLNNSGGNFLYLQTSVTPVQSNQGFKPKSISDASKVKVQKDIPDFSNLIDSPTARYFKNEVIDKKYTYGMSTDPLLKANKSSGKGLPGEKEIDCSGAICKVLTKKGLNIGDPTVKNSAQHFHDRSKSVKWADVKDGDLITMKTSGGKVDHIGFIVIDKKTGKKFIAESSRSFNEGRIVPFKQRIDFLKELYPDFVYSIRRM